jgi:hypothetical protein
MTTSRRYREQRNKLNANLTKGKEPAKKRGTTAIEMSKKKIFNIAPPEVKKIFNIAPPEIIIEASPGLTLSELVAKTSIKKNDIKYYHDNGLLPDPIKYKDETYWPVETPTVLKLVHAERRRGHSVKKIRENLLKKIRENLFPRKSVSRSVPVQPRWQSVRVINSQRQMFDATYKGGDYDFLDSVRIFRPLKPSGKKPGVNVVLHIPIQMNIKGCSKSKRDSDIDCLEKNLILLEQHAGFAGDLIISVNGFIDNEFIPDVKWLETINNTQIGPFNVIVFQRPNFGYQWGGFYDIWQKYKNSGIEFFATLECDCCLLSGWYEKCIGNIKNHGFVGMPPKRDLGANQMYFFTGRIWRNSGDKALGLGKSGTVDKTVMTHTRGGFYFCHRSMLERIDEAYGCFTESMGCDPAVDGVAMGEIGFASKAGQLGISFIDMENVVYPTEGLGWPKDLILLL